MLKQRLPINWKTYCSIVLFVLAAACSPVEKSVLAPTAFALPTLLPPSATLTPQNTPTNTVTRVVPTATPTATPTASRTSQLDPTPVRTRGSSPTSTLTFTPTREPTPTATETPTRVVIETRYVKDCAGANIRICAGVSATCSIIKRLSFGTRLEVTGVENRWYSVYVPDQEISGFVAEWLTINDPPSVCYTYPTVGPAEPGMTVVPTVEPRASVDPITRPPLGGEATEEVNP
jgi:hypothetical protein